MIRYKRLINTCFLVLCATVMFAQSGSNSPYTRYGYGQLSDQSFGNSKAMGGLSYGLRDGFQINASNPASYTAVDSLTFLFDAGLSLQNANFKEGSVQTNAKNSTVDYIAMQFRLFEGMGFSAGFLPYSIVGYNMSQTYDLGTDGLGNPIQVNDNYTGTGGLQQVYVGVGYKVFNNLSVGVNFSYLFGEISHSISTTFNNSNAFSSMRTDMIDVNDYKLDLGLQYTQTLGEKHAVNLGAVYSLGHDLNSNGYKYTATYSTSNTVLQSQTVDTLKNAFSLPHTFGVGFTYVYDKRLTVGLDYTQQKWADINFFNKQGAFTNRSKLSFGAEFVPKRNSKNYFSRIRYRLGAYYSDPYAKVNENEGAREYGASFGFGFPILRSNSILNISGQYINVKPKVAGMLEENYLKINVGLTFNERWFMKWKVD